MGYIFAQTFTKGVDQSVHITSDNPTVSDTTTFEHMYVQIAGYLDGSYETLAIDDSFDPFTLAFESVTPHNSAPNVIHFTGTGTSATYLAALQSVMYANTKDRPTEGERIIVTTLFDGALTNPMTMSYTTMTVTIHNLPPLLSVSGSQDSYENRFFPYKLPVSAISPLEAYVIDTDSVAIEGASLRLNNSLNGAYEILQATYISPESLSLPIVVERYGLDIPFGMLWRGEVVPTITSVISVAEVGVVGDVIVIVDIRHSWVGDLQIELEHGSRTELLVLSPGGRLCQRDDLFRTTFDSDSSSNVTLSRATDSPGVCRFQSEGLFSTDGDLTVFRGSSVEGEWKLHVTDLLLESDNGQLVSWAVVIQPEETHLVAAYPPVVPTLVVGQEKEYEERNVKEVASDGRIAEMSVHVQLAVGFTANYLYLPSLTLVHPDGTQVVLADSEEPLCAEGNYTYLVFDDRAQPYDYHCTTLLSQQTSGSGSGSSGMGSGNSTNGTEMGLGNDQLMPIMSGSSSGSGSGSGMGLQADGISLTYQDVLDLNVTLPVKESLADILTPVSPLSSLTGKPVGGSWTLVLSSEHPFESTLLGWSLRVAREPNIDATYDTYTNTLTLSGADSPENYQRVLRSVEYENIAEEPEFLTVRRMDTQVFDGELHSNTSLPSSKSYIVIHHIDIDLDPLGTTPAAKPDYHTELREHLGDSIPILDPENAILQDSAFSSGDYYLTVTLRDYLNVGDEGLVLNISAAPGLQFTFTNTTQELTLEVSRANSNLLPIESVEAVLRSIEYYNHAEEFTGSNRTIEFIVKDYQNGSRFTSRIATALVVFVPTNDLPILDLNLYFTNIGELSNVVSYEEDQGVVALTNATALVLSDNDHTYLESVTISIRNPQDGANELLAANTTGTAIEVSYDNTTNTLLLNGTDTLDNYTLVLGTVTYENMNPDMPGTEPREVSFVPFDGTNFGPPAVALVTFAAVNDPALGDLNGLSVMGTSYVTGFLEEGGPVAIVSNETVLYDVDDTSLAYFEVSITNPRDGSDEVLSVVDIIEQVDQEDDKITTVTTLRPDVSYDLSTHTLRVSGLDSVSEYQDVIRTLTYNNLADEPSPETREILVTLNDGHESSQPLNITVEIVLENDSPYFNPTAPPFQPEIYEDIPDELNAGISIPEISYLIIDDDQDARKGVAIAELDFENGKWQLSLDSGTTWEVVQRNISLTNALTIESLPENRVRFVPDHDFNGYSRVLFVAWDGTDGVGTGVYVDARSTSDIDPFSSEELEVVLTIAAVNDAPVLEPVPVQLATIMEDDFNSTGDTVLSFLQYANASDVDGDELGIAVVTAEQEYGVWQYTTNGGQTWEEFGEVNDSSAIVLRSYPEHSNRVRFMPVENFNGNVSLVFHAWDLTRLPGDEPTLMSGGNDLSSTSGDIGIGLSSGSGSGSSGLSSDFDTNTTEPAVPPYESGTYINITASHPETGLVSVASSIAVLTVEPVNDSPVIREGMTLHSIMENTAESLNHGTRISDIVTEEFYTDVDENPYKGLAVVGVDDRHGEWQYTCEDPNNRNWETFIGDMYYGDRVPHLPLPEKATLLLSNCYIRFLPDPHFNTELETDGYHVRPESDIPYIVAHGWDNTGATAGLNGTYGNDASYAAESDTNEYSSNMENIHITIVSVNTVPKLMLTSPEVADYETTFVEDLSSVSIVGDELTLTDYDHARLIDVTITIHGGMFTDSPFSIDDFGSPFSGDDVLFPISGGSAEESGSGSSSGSGSGSGMASGTNDTASGTCSPVLSSAPSLPPLHQIQEFVSSQSNPPYEERYCAGMEPRREELFIDTSHVDLTHEVLAWCPFTLRIFATDPSCDAPKEHFEGALRTLRYNNSVQEPEGGDRIITFLVSDNVGLSIPVNSIVHIQLINDAPVLDLNSHIPDVNSYVSYTEGQGPLVLANSSLVLIDHDDTHLQSARIVLAEAPDEDSEILEANVNGTTIQMSYENYTLWLSGNDTLGAYADVLQTVTYTNNYSHPGAPDERERQVLFYVNDGTNDSMVAIAFVSFTGVNDKPRLDVNGDERGVNYTVTFYEEMGPIPIVSPDLVIHDEDNFSIAYITATILNLPDAPLEFLDVDMVTMMEVLQRNRYNESKVVSVTTLRPNVTFDPETGVLNVTGLDSTQEYIDVLSETITYDNLADEPDLTPREIVFVANDGDLSSDPVSTTVILEPVNDSPRFNISSEVLYPLILEDQRVDSEILISMIATEELIEDDDADATRGLAVISVDNENGQWQYRLNTSAEWKDIWSDTSVYTAVLLRSDGDNAIRFYPDQDFNGNTSIEFVAWDGTDMLPDGTTRIVISSNGTNSFSEGSRTMTLRVVPVNDAPVLNTTAEIEMTSILEDSVREWESLGDEVSPFLSALLEDVDVDIATHEFGIAVVGADTSNGFWQVSVNGGMNWTDIGQPLQDQAVVLRSRPEGENRIRFVPDPNFNGVSSFQFKIWDQNTSYPSGTFGIDTTITDSITGTFSVEIATALLTIEPVNDSPVLSGELALTEFDEDLPPDNNRGTLIRVIIEDAFEDIDGPSAGVAVVGTDTRYGEWQYTCDSGSIISWLPFIGGYQFGQIAPRHPLPERATLLSEDCLIRFLPDENFNTQYSLTGDLRDPGDTPTILLRAWDGTAGDNMEISVDTTSEPDDHTNAFGLEMPTAMIEILSVNDPPVLSLSGDSPDYLVTFTEPVPPGRDVIPVPIVDTSTLSLIDVDNASLQYVQVNFFLFDGDNESLLIDVSGTSLNYSVDYPSGNLRLRIEPSMAVTAPIEEFEAVLRTLRYQNAAEEPDSTTRLLRFSANDGLDSSSPVSTSLMIALVNDPPELDLNTNRSGTYNYVRYTEGDGAIPVVDSSAKLIDHDNDTLHSARITILHAPDEDQEILVADVTTTSITASYNGSELTLVGLATVEEYENVIKSVTYENIFAEPGNPSTLERTIQFVVNDGLSDSIPALVILSFMAENNAPLLDVSGELGVNYQAVFREEEGPVRVVSENTTVEDLDNTTLAFIEVTITNPRDGELEYLKVDEEVEVTSAPLTDKHVEYWFYRPEQYYNVSTATLRISGLDAVREYEKVLRTLKYNNFADEPSNETRLLHFTVSDGLLARQGVYSQVEIVNINDSPYFNETSADFRVEIDEDVHKLLNPGWSVEEIVQGRLLDDDADSLAGIAVVGLDISNGHWEFTTDFSDSPPSETPPGTNGDASGMLQPSSGAFSSGDIMSGMSSGDLFGGSSGSDEASGGSGDAVSGLMSAVSGLGSAVFGSGSGSGSGFGSGEPEVSPPKCRETTPLTQPPVAANFSATWQRFPVNTSLTYATVLRANREHTRIRFVPNRDFDEIVQLTFVAWDTTGVSLEDGTVANATSKSQTDPFSEGTMRVYVSVQSVNDAPVLSNQTFDLTSIYEDDVSSFGDDVGDLVLGVSDVDSSDLEFGIAIMFADEENGVWQFSTDGGQTWVTSFANCPYNATVLSSQPYGLNRVRFVPSPDFNGFATFTFVAWDFTSGEESGTMGVDTSIADPITGAFSTSSTTATVFVEPVNDSPVLAAGAHLSPVVEDTPTAENNGTAVRDIVEGYYLDVDFNSEVGIAVVGVDLRFGEWEWRCPDSDWTEFIGDIIYGVILPATPRVEKATLLSGDCRVRFLPNENFNTLRDTDGNLRPSTDTPYITIRAWDNTGLTESLSGTFGVDSTYNTDSITNEFGAETENATVEVISVNDLPVFGITSSGDGLSFETQFTEDEPFVRIVEPAAVSLTDADHARLQSVTITVTNVLDTSAELITLELPPNTTTIDLDPTTNVATVTLGDSTEAIQLSYPTGPPNTTTLLLAAPNGASLRVSVEAYQEILRYVVYKNMHPEPDNTTRLIQFFVDDSEDVNSLVETLVDILLLNDNPPVLTNYLRYVTFIEDGPSPVPITSGNLTLTDEDHNQFFFMNNLTVRLIPVPVAPEENISLELSVVSMEYSVIQEYDSATGNLVAVGSAPVSVYEALLRTLSYHNTIEEPLSGIRTITMETFDGVFSSNLQAVMVNVVIINDQPPVVSVPMETFMYTEMRSPTSIGDNLTVSDADSGGFPLENVTFTITDARDGDYEILNITTFGNLTATFTNSVLLLSGPAPIQDFLLSMATLTYTNTAEEPRLGRRLVAVEANDGDFPSEVEFIELVIELVNDLPVVDLNGPVPGRGTMVNYVEGVGPVALAPNASLSDNDHDHLSGLTVVIINLLDSPNEILNVSVPEGANLTVSYDENMGVLVVTGNSSLTTYQEVLQSLTYENTEAMPGFPDTDPRMIDFIVFDGHNYSEPVQALLTFDSVNDAPIIDLNGRGTNYSTMFVEEGPAVLLTPPEFMLFDVDNTTLVYVRITIENLLDGDEEVLAVGTNLSDQLDLGVSTYDAGVLNIVGLNSVEEFREVVASVTYQNLADEPDYETRTISFVASDGLLDSKVHYTSVIMTAVNDPPCLLITGGQRIGPPPVPPDPTEAPTTMEPDMGSSSGSGMGPMTSGSGLGELSGSGALLSGSGSGMASGDLGSGMEREMNETTGMVSNETANTTGVSICDSIGGEYMVVFDENSPPVPIVDLNGVLVEDDDDGNLLRLEVVLEGVLDPGYETIFFDHTSLENSLVARLIGSGLTGDGTSCSNSSVGAPHEVLDLSVNPLLSIVEWEQVVRSLRYCNFDEFPLRGNRTITFRIQDPSLVWSEIRTTTVEVTSINDAPICSTPVDVFTIQEDTNLTLAVLQNCFDFEEELTGASIIIHTYPLNASVFVDPETGNITFFPDLDVYGSRSFAYQACDSLGACSTPQVITVMISPVNDPPYPAQNLTLVLEEDTNTTIALTQFFGDVEDDLVPGNSYPRVVSITGSTSSNWRLIADDPDSSLFFSPFLNFVGNDRLELEVCDSEDACIIVTVNVTITPINDLPEIIVIYPEGMPPAETIEDELLRIAVVIRDVEDREELNVSVVHVGNGTAVPDRSEIMFEIEAITDFFRQSMHLNYTPSLNFYGDDTVTFTATDSNGGQTEAVVYVSVEYENDPPEFGRTELTVIEDQPRSWRLPNDLQVTDPEDILHAGSFTIITLPDIGNVTYTFNETFLSETGMFPAYGTLTYHPPTHYFSPEGVAVNFTLQACDSDTVTFPLCTNVTIFITILEDNDAPILEQVTLVLDEDGIGTINLWEYTSDVEEGRPPVGNVFLITEDPPQKGVATYNNVTGELTYIPYLNAYGEDFVYYNACDSQNHCSSLRGEVLVIIQEVNDPPSALDFTHIAREDDFDLIAFYNNITDNETSTDILRLAIRDPNTGNYLNEWTTAIGGSLRVYHAHQIITYKPPDDYVGLDTFRYSVCDPCDPRRDDELGRVDADPPCIRQNIENGGSIFHSGSDIYITCAEATVEIVVANVNDVPRLIDIAAVIDVAEVATFTPFEDSRLSSNHLGYLYSNSSASVFEPDDLQLLTAVIEGLDLSLYRLDNDTDIDEQSLAVRMPPENGFTSVMIVNGLSQVTYTPFATFSGYDQFTYEICDKIRDSDEPRCSEATARVLVTRPGPEIAAVIASGATLDDGTDSDSKVGAGDTITLRFAEDTNMPPYGTVNALLSTADVDELLVFDPPFIHESIVPGDRYMGSWASPTELTLTIVDEGYPQPYITEGTGSDKMYTEVKVGEWQVQVRETSVACGGFDVFGQPVEVGEFCLLNADQTSLHSTSTSPPLRGNFGRRLPTVASVVIQNVAVEDSSLANNVDGLAVKSQIALYFQPPLSHAQLEVYCNRDPNDILDADQLGDNVQLIVTGCTNLLNGGQRASLVYEDNIRTMESLFSGQTKREIHSVTGDNPEGERVPRQVDSSPTEQPVASEVILQAQTISSSAVNPLNNPRLFASTVQSSVNQQTLAEVIFETMGVTATILDEYSSNVEPIVDDPFSYFEHDDTITPQVVAVVADDPDDADNVYSVGDTITITFDRPTDQPAVSTRTNIDRIMTFSPALGSRYSGRWTTPSTLEITIDALLNVRPSLTNFSLTFTPNYFHTGQAVSSTNNIVPTDVPWCIGINVCGTDALDDSTPQTTGICTADQLSCRAHGSWSTLDGDFGTGSPEEVDEFPWWWIVIAVLVVIAIVVVVIVVYFCYRYYTHKAQRKEALRVVRRWKKDHFAPGKEVERKREGPKPWVKPPDVSTMRENPDPFESTLKKLPSVIRRPPTAMTGRPTALAASHKYGCDKRAHLYVPQLHALSYDPLLIYLYRYVVLEARYRAMPDVGMQTRYIPELTRDN